MTLLRLVLPAAALLAMSGIATAATTPVAHPATAAVPAPAAAPVLPGKIDPKYASLTAGKAREKTCLDQYHANKATGGNAGLKWIAKGGYYSVCSKHLKAV